MPNPSELARAEEPRLNGTGQRLRACSHEGCIARPHYENCTSCMGWGFATSIDPQYIISAREIDQPEIIAAATACPECGGLPPARRA